MRHDNYPPDYEQMKHTIDDPIEETEEISEFDDSDDFREQMHEAGMDAITGLGIPEDEAENLLEDMGM